VPVAVLSVMLVVMLRVAMAVAAVALVRRGGVVVEHNINVVES